MTLEDRYDAALMRATKAEDRVRELEALLPLAREGASNYMASELDEDYPGVRKTLGFIPASESKEPAK